MYCSRFRPIVLALGFAHSLYGCWEPEWAADTGDSAAPLADLDTALLDAAVDSQEAIAEGPQQDVLIVWPPSNGSAITLDLDQVKPAEVEIAMPDGSVVLLEQILDALEEQARCQETGSLMDIRLDGERVLITMREAPDREDVEQLSAHEKGLWKKIKQWFRDHVSTSGSGSTTIKIGNTTIIIIIVKGGGKPDTGCFPQPDEE